MSRSSDSENEDELMENLFGSDDDEAPSSSAPKTTQTQEEVIALPTYPKFNKNSKLYFVRLSAHFGIQPKPFDRDTYDGEDMEPLRKIDEFGAVRSRPAPQNMIRWRWTTNNNGHKIRQSNSKIVKWSDGSLMMYIGKNAFPIHESSMTQPIFVSTKSSVAIQTQTILTNRMNITSEIQSTTFAPLADTSVVSPPTKKQPVVLSTTVQQQIKERAALEAESARLRGGPGSRKRKDAPSMLSADFLEEGTDLAATKAAFRRDRTSRGTNKRKKTAEEDEDEESVADNESDDGFIVDDDEE